MKTFKSKIDKVSLVREKQEFYRAKIGSSRDSADYCRQFFKDDLDLFESFFIVMLNNANNTIGFAKISQGGIAGTLVDVRIVVKYAVDSMCTGMIVCHNHPSGSLNPSQADKSLTKKLQGALQLFDVKLLDHIILTEDSYTSFADENLL